MSKRNRHAQKVARLAGVQREQAPQESDVKVTQIVITRDLDTEGFSLEDLKRLTKECDEAVDQAMMNFIIREKNSGQPVSVEVVNTETDEAFFMSSGNGPPDKGH